MRTPPPHGWQSIAAFIVVASLIPPPARAQSGGVHPQAAPVANAVRLTGSVSVDGKLDEEVWRSAPAITEFRQSQPNEGKAGTQRTEVRFAYDDAALYVGAKMFDSLGSKGVVSRLLRRDALTETDSDVFQIVLDSYHDHSSRFVFWVNPSGSKRDGTGGDPTWDPVWEAKGQIDAEGWTAEMRIPFNQLNFSRDTDQTWGIQVIRFVHRLNERTHFAWWPNNEVGGPQRYGHLDGIKISERPRGMELLPYTVGRARYVRPLDSSNPFTKTSEKDYRLGGDIKYRLTSNLTLNATINPDFGQVEVDPAVVNLSAFETFFSEKRPFFIEGQNAFSFGNFNCYFCSNVSNLSLFYTRRIGRSPQLFPSGTYVDQPENATILAAGKVTGRTRSNVLVGVLDAVTRREMANVITLDGSGARASSKVEVEPLTNYFVGRALKEIQGGAHSFGGIVTSVDRFTSDSLAEARLPGNARSVGVDWFSSWKNRTYSFMGQYAVSDVRGSKLAMQRIQRTSARYFQRPDRSPGGNGVFSDEFDENATSLSGYGGYARVAKDGGTWLWEGMVNYRSPGFEVNDMAFNTTADYVYFNANLARSVTKPGPIFRNYFATLGAQQQTNYDGDLTDREYSAGIFSQLANFWRANAFVIRSAKVYDDRLLRGGPVIQKRGYRYQQIFLGTDARKDISMSINPSFTDFDYGPDGLNLNANVTWKPTSNVQLSAGPSFNRGGSVSQFVTSIADPTATAFYGRRYIFAAFNQKQLAMSTRANVTFTPQLTFELFAQPLIASGDYVTFNEYVRPRSNELRAFTGDQVSSTIVNGSRRYTIDPDGPSGPAASLNVFDPDFNFRALRGNAVVRWEYRPGSTLFFVWQQNRSDTDAVGNFDFGRDRNALFDAHPDNIFLVKATYWIAF